jgi:PAS domain S-box-containing protein
MADGPAGVREGARAEAAQPFTLDYTRIFDSAPALLLVLANDGRFSILGATDAYLRATHTVRDQILGQGLFEVFPDNPDEPGATGASNLRASLERVIARRAPDIMAVQKYDVRRPESEGGGFEVRYWSPVNAPVLSDDGEIRQIVHRVEDVTELVVSKQAAESDTESMRLEVLLRSGERDDANRRLGQAHALYHAIYDQGLFAGQLNLDGTVVDANRASVEGCGFVRAEIIGRPLWECGWWSRNRAISAWVRAAVMQAVGGEPFRGDTRYYLADGTERMVDFACMPIKDAHGNVILVLSTGMDVTERARAEETQRGYEEQRQRAEALAELDGAKTAFIATLSHELRNPLAPLRNALSLLRGNRRLPPTRIAALHEMMERQVNHLVRLVDDLLEMSRITRGVLELRRERVELDSVVRNAVETSEPLIREGGHRLEVQLPPGPVWLEGDPVRLAQLFANLLNNAARFTPHGGCITIAADVSGIEARVAVRDSGRGFVPEVAASLFEMFRKSDRSSGLGIGLALARHLTELHGGTITGHSDGEGRGAEFVVRIPIVEAEARLATAPPERTPAAVARRVLVADDNRDSAESLADLLRDLGNEVQLAFDGSEAVEAARTFRPDLALLDIGMPKLDGYQAAQRIRGDADGRPLKLVALTGWGQDDDRRKAREAGFDEHLVKPAEIATLRRILEGGV